MSHHLTVTAFVAAEGHTLLHWHAKNQMWLPPGGHVEADEDPLQALHREVLEEAGFGVLVLPSVTRFDYQSPPQLPPPVTIMVEVIPASAQEAAHTHLDLVYFTRPLENGHPPTPPDGWLWVAVEALRANLPLAGNGEGASIRASEDVRTLGLAAIQRALEEDD